MRTRVAIAVLCASAAAEAQWAPQQQQPQQQQQQPYQQQQPGQWTPAPGARTGSGRTEAELREAERRDAGRGLEWFFIAPEVGVTNIGVTSLSNSSLLPGVSSQTGSQLGLGLGARLLYVTAGVRGRLAFMPDFKMWSVGPEVSFHVPMGSLEPYALAGLGYTSLGAISDPNDFGIKIRGVNARLGGGADYYFTPGFSVGGLATMETLFLSRPAVDATNAGELKNGGSSVGLALSASLVLGLHL